MKKNSPVQTAFTLIAVVIILIIAFTDKFDIVLILPILGGFCAAHGIFGLIRTRSMEVKDGTASGRCLLQIILGGFIMMLGIIELADVTLPQNFWNFVLVVIVVIALIWMFLRKRDAFKNH